MQRDVELKRIEVEAKHVFSSIRIKSFELKYILYPLF